MKVRASVSLVALAVLGKRGVAWAAPGDKVRVTEGTADWRPARK